MLMTINLRHELAHTIRFPLTTFERVASFTIARAGRYNSDVRDG
jgi:hypothetical protein